MQKTNRISCIHCLGREGSNAGMAEKAVKSADARKRRLCLRTLHHDNSGPPNSFPVVSIHSAPSTSSINSGNSSYSHFLISIKSPLSYLLSPNRLSYLRFTIMASNTPITAAPISYSSTYLILISESHPVNTGSANSATPDAV